MAGLNSELEFGVHINLAYFFFAVILILCVYTWPQLDHILAPVSQ